MMSTRHLRLPAAVLLLSLLMAPHAPAAAPASQDPDNYALLFGTVYGPDKRPVHGVQVKIRRASEKKARWHLYSDRRGEFAQRLPVGPGEYVVWAEVKGKKAPKGQSASELRVRFESDERQDISLHLTE